MRRVLLVENHAAFRDALTTLLNIQPDLDVVGRAGSLADGRAVAALQEVDVAVVGLYLPNGNGVELVHELHRGVYPLIIQLKVNLSREGDKPCCSWCFWVPALGQLSKREELAGCNGSTRRALTS